MKKISRLLKKKVLFSWKWGETLWTRKDWKHKHWHWGVYRSKKSYKKQWNRSYRNRSMSNSETPYNKYTEYWDFD